MKATMFAGVLSLIAVSLPAQSASTPIKPVSASITQTLDNKIDLNTADVQTLSHSLKGIGKKRAESIVSYREAHHGFKSIDELMEVKGLGKSFVNKHLAELQTVFIIK